MAETQDTRKAPAFPQTGETLIGAGAGMTLRDYFAAKSMEGMSSGGIWPNTADAPEIAKRAYAIADAMLAERAK